MTSSQSAGIDSLDEGTNSNLQYFYLRGSEYLKSIGVRPVGMKFMYSDLLKPATLPWRVSGKTALYIICEEDWPLAADNEESIGLYVLKTDLLKWDEYLKSRGATKNSSEQGLVLLPKDTLDVVATDFLHEHTLGIKSVAKQIVMYEGNIISGNQSVLQKRVPALLQAILKDPVFKQWVKE